MAARAARGSYSPSTTGISITTRPRFPILEQEGATAAFYLISDFVGSNRIQWWDQIAFSLGTAQRRLFSLAGTEIDLDRDGLERSKQRILALYRAARPSQHSSLLTELREACGAPPPPSRRMFFNWDEARTMLGAGMEIGSHTVSHPELSYLEEEAQMRELSESKQILEEKLGCAIRTVAYPLGVPETFNAETKRAAESAGYDLGFSFYGGLNRRGASDLFDVRRHAVCSFDQGRFRFQLAAAALTGEHWF